MRDSWSPRICPTACVGVIRALYKANIQDTEAVKAEGSCGVVEVLVHLQEAVHLQDRETHACGLKVMTSTSTADDAESHSHAFNNVSITYLLGALAVLLDKPGLHRVGVLCAQTQGGGGHSRQWPSTASLALDSV